MSRYEVQRCSIHNGGKYAATRRIRDGGGLRAQWSHRFTVHLVRAFVRHLSYNLLRCCYITIPRDTRATRRRSFCGNWDSLVAHRESKRAVSNFPFQCRLIIWTSRLEVSYLLHLFISTRHERISKKKEEFRLRRENRSAAMENARERMFDNCENSGQLYQRVVPEIKPRWPSIIFRFSCEQSVDH